MHHPLMIKALLRTMDTYNKYITYKMFASSLYPTPILMKRTLKPVNLYQNKKAMSPFSIPMHCSSWSHNQENKTTEEYQTATNQRFKVSSFADDTTYT